ncbi:hypothetical protein ACQEVB_15225 [Pseudonocardia sp. CA-107938]|uniref:hypothetical protein n=1 Tax=Pseudonocardia sp. CA-107938 TaxID=3240021 RepID=UPI003D931438
MLPFVAGVAVVAAIAGGLLWWQAATSPAVATAQARDLVLDAGSRALVELNTIASDDADAAADRWERNATGPLLAQLRKQREQTVTAAKAARTSSTARPLQAAVTELDRAAGTARLLAALEVRVTTADGQVATKRTRLAAALTRTPDGWLLSEVDVVGLST